MCFKPWLTIIVPALGMAASRVGIGLSPTIGMDALLYVLTQIDGDKLVCSSPLNLFQTFSGPCSHDVLFNSWFERGLF